MATQPGTIASMAERLLTPAEDLDEAPEAETEEEQTSEEQIETEEEAETPEGDTEPTFTVKIGDEEQEVTLEELTKGYLREGDYTRKTMELGDQRKVLAGKLERLDSALEEAEILSKLVDETDLDKLEEEDPEGYIAHTKAAQKRQQRLDELRKERDQQKQDGAALNDEEEGAKLAAAIPDWIDLEVRASDVKLMQKVWAQSGYTDADVGTDVFHDHRFMVLSRKAALYDKIMAADPGSKKVTTKPKSAEPAAAEKPKPERQKRIDKAREKAKQTGRMQDVAKAFEAMITEG